VKTLTSVVTWCFAMDYVHYTDGILCICMTCANSLKKHPSVHQAFYPDTFVINKTWWPFSAIASDHVHALCSSMVKYGQATNPAALCRWI